MSFAGIIAASGMSAAAAGPYPAIVNQEVEKQVSSPGHTAFYVDSAAGDDANPGTSRRLAWKSIERVNRTIYGPGDSIRFAGAQQFTGTLRFGRKDCGTEAHPIVISSIGSERAIINAGIDSACELVDSSWIVVEKLKLVGVGRKNGSNGSGVSLLRTHDVKIDRIEASGFRVAGISTGGDTNSTITRVSAHDNGFAGIATDSGYGDIPRSHNLVIRDCRAINNPGDPKNLDNHSGNGIVVGGVDGALIEYCEASNNGWDMPRDGNGPVGIWGWNCDRLVIQHCISHDNKSPGADGGGFDFDGAVTNSILQYNLSYHNMGAGYLLCQFGGAGQWKNNIVRYNISFDDGSKNFQAGIGLWLGDKGISDAQIYNNTIVNPAHAVSTLGDVPGMLYRNNLFIGGSDLLVGDLSHSRFENNLYWSTGKGALLRNGDTAFADLKAWAQASSQETSNGKVIGLTADPRIVLPDSFKDLPTDPRKLTSMPYFRLKDGSPAVGAGMQMAGNGGRDLFGRRLSEQEPPSLGADRSAGRTRG